jgi:antibiotic biosynthesis monooxygenase (ABM) superfamily enzyme
MSVHQRQPELRAASLAEITGRPLPDLETVTAVIEHTVKREAVPAYEAWLKEVVPIAARFPGHRGVNVIHPPKGGLQYTITIHFDSLAHAQDWFESDARRELMQRVAALLDGEERVETRSGLEFWFHPAPGQPPAKRYKQFLVTLSVIYPLTMLVPTFLHWLLGSVAWLGAYWIEHLVAAAVVVALMVYVIMPRYTRLVSRWLYR